MTQPYRTNTDPDDYIDYGGCLITAVWIPMVIVIVLVAGLLGAFR